MSPAEQLLSRIVAWATGEEPVRRLVLVGSRARAAPPDDLADIDLQVYVETSEPYLCDDAWLSGIGHAWLCVRDVYSDGDIEVPTRLVIFEGGVKVDFAFYPAGVVSDGLRAGLAHRVLLEKDPTDPAAALPALSPGKLDGPGEAEFRRTVEEFWFEAYHVAKYLARNELWLAKSRDWAMKQMLQRMIEWHEQFTRGHAPGSECEGRRASMGEDTWEALHRTFAGFESEESWGAAHATMGLFGRLGREVGTALGFAYPLDVEESMSRLILGLRSTDRPVHDSVREELIALANDWDRAMVENDADAIGRFMADDWTIIGPDGSACDKATFLGLVRSGALSHDVTGSSEMDVRVYGDAAVIIARGVSGGRYQGQAFHGVERASCVFVRQEGRWRCVLTHHSRLAE